MASAVRFHGSQKNKLLNESLPLDSADTNRIAFAESPEALLEIQENFQNILKRMELSLSPLERRVLALYLSGYERSEIPEKNRHPP